MRLSLSILVFLVLISACDVQSDKSSNEIATLKHDINELKSSQTSPVNDIDNTNNINFQISKQSDLEFLSAERSERICVNAYKHYLAQKYVISTLKTEYFISDSFGVYNENTDMLLCAITFDLVIHERNGFTKNEFDKFYHVGRSDDELVLPVEHITHDLFKSELALIQNESNN